METLRKEILTHVCYTELVYNRLNKTQKGNE
jgi:hypothetical protein